MSLRSRAVGMFALSILATTVISVPAEARYRYADPWFYGPYAWTRQQYAVPSYGALPSYGGVPSFDGRVTGRPRTCGFDTFRYDQRGATMGPYCH
jgi:hypothetical protein